jgi:hypothetical protein
VAPLRPPAGRRRRGPASPTAPLRPLLLRPALLLRPTPAPPTGPAPSFSSLQGLLKCIHMNNLMFCILFQSNTKANLTALPILPTPSTGGSSRQFASFSLSKRTRAPLLCSVCSFQFQNSVQLASSRLDSIHLLARLLPASSFCTYEWIQQPVWLLAYVN